MPHYKDGTQARVGDIVRGKGYNVKDEKGNLKEIVGIVLSINPNVKACNLTLIIPHDAFGQFSSGSKYGAMILGATEYGQTDHFEKVT